MRKRARNHKKGNILRKSTRNIIYENSLAFDKTPIKRRQLNKEVKATLHDFYEAQGKFYGGMYE